ncbi:hypothetical protein Hdeb2414_s0011g00371321 [Helianthus debilis subsp. tardiflorus]
MEKPHRSVLLFSCYFSLANTLDLCFFYKIHTKILLEKRSKSCSSHLFLSISRSRSSRILFWGQTLRAVLLEFKKESY